ncbi:MAG TPA: maltotransferase domain-containing protein, partial [Aldersonia sp.]
MTGRIAIDDTVPDISGGRPAKAVVGEVFPVKSVVWREGHDAVAANLSFREPSGKKSHRVAMVRGAEPNVFHGVFTPTVEGVWTYRVEGWGDPIATWRHHVEAKLAVGQSAAELANDLEVGARLFERAAKGVPRDERPRFLAAAAALRSDEQLPARAAPAFASEIAQLLEFYPLRDLLTKTK